MSERKVSVSMFQKSKIKIILLGLIFLSVPLVSQATEIEFNIDPNYDSLGRSKINAFLHQIGENAYFFAEEDFYGKLDIEKRIEITESLRNLSQEFDNNIYLKLRELFGSEWNPGIDADKKIYVLITQIKGDAGGYFNSGDEYSKIQSSDSNEKEIIYLNSSFINTPLAKSFLAHEFLHLITFNQKEKVLGLTEEVWLNEARAEMAPTILGYDDVYPGSSLQKRVRTFLQKPQDSLTEWKGDNFDYGALNLFFQYLIDHYGVRILADSLKINKAGIPSLNDALKKNGFAEDFAQIFTNWTAAVLTNDCSLGPKYCYLNQNLKNIRISPQLNFLPSIGESSLTVIDYTKNWSGNWYKFIGGQGTLKLEFIGDQKAIFKIPYLLEDSLGKYTLDYLKLDVSQHGTNYFGDFGKKYVSLTIIPSLQVKESGFNGVESYSKFIWTVSVINESQKTKEEEELTKNLLAQIASLQEQIARLQLKIAEKLAKEGSALVSCSKIENNLSYGMRNNTEVRCLQTFLKNQGRDVYSEGLVTGNFGILTQRAVTRFQEKYASEILTPLGLSRGTGIVGPATRTKINQLLNK